MNRTSLTRFAPSMRDPDPDGPAKAARQAWQEHGILTVLPGQVHGLDREFVTALGNRLWGKRG
jgi:hypothetical protein